MSSFDPTKYGFKSVGTNNSASSIPSSGDGASLTPSLSAPPTAPKPTSSVPFPSSPQDTGLQAGLKATGNLVPSALNFGKSLIQPILHPIKTIQTVDSALLGGTEKLANAATRAVGGTPTADKYAPTFDALASGLKERYGGLDNLRKTATEDPFGFGADVLSVLEGGASLAGKSSELSGAISKVASPITKPVAKMGELAGATLKEAATGAAGVATGVGKEAFVQALKNEPGFTEGLRNKINLTDVLDEAQQGLGQVKRQRSTEYTQAMENLKTTNPQSLDISPVIEKAKGVLEDFNVKPGKNGGIDLSRSPLINDEKKVNAVLDTLDTWGTKEGDRTIQGVDMLKRQLKAFREPTNPTLNRFVDQLSSSAADIARKVPGYSDLQKTYGRYSDFVDELERTLSLKESATPDTAISKLNSLLRDNADYRRQLAGELKSVTGKDIMSPIAGKALSKFTPQGLAKYTAGAVGVAGGVAMPHILPFLAVSSPRLMGEFFRLAGVSGRGAAEIMSNINNFRISAGLNEIKVKLPKGMQEYIESPKAGMSIRDVSKNIPKNDLDIMTKFIDHAEDIKKFPMSESEFATAETIAKGLGLSMDKGLKGVASKFRDIIEGGQHFPKNERVLPVVKQEVPSKMSNDQIDYQPTNY